jgi:hypothetical protein
MAGRPSIQLDTAIVKRMYSLGIKMSIIAASFGVSIAKIRTVRDEHNLPLRRKKVIYNENEFRGLFESRITYNEMAKQLGMSRCSVIDIKKRLGLPNRNRLHKKVKNDR